MKQNKENAKHIYQKLLCFIVPLLIGGLLVGCSHQKTQAIDDFRVPVVKGPRIGISLIDRRSFTCLFFGWDELTSRSLAMAPIKHEQYYRGERELFGYNPPFVPNVVSFNPDNVPVIRNGPLIQWLDQTECSWKTKNFLNLILREYSLEEDGFDTETAMKDLISSAADLRIVFDDSGDGYMHVASQLWPGVGRSLLLHFRAGGANWDIYELPDRYRFARLEFQDSFNDLKHPPILILWDPTLPEIAVLAPRKNSDGTLTLDIPEMPRDLPNVIRDSIPTSAQVGGSNTVITEGRYSYIVYASCVYPDGLYPSITFRTPCGNADRKPDVELPGTPSYIRKYDHETNTLSEPVFIGYGGIGDPDDHNVPAITIDHAGYLHVILGAHHNQFRYIRSVKPVYKTRRRFFRRTSRRVHMANSWRTWTEPQLLGSPEERVEELDPECSRTRVVMDGSEVEVTGHCNRYTYASFLTGSDGVLHLVSRWAGDTPDVGVYYMRLAYLRKPKGRDWEPRKTLVVPFKPWYSNWYQKLSIDRFGRLFLYYTYFGNNLFKNEIEEYKMKWPEEDIDWTRATRIDPITDEKVDCPEPIETGEGRPCWYVDLKSHDPVLLMSNDGGNSWNIATSADF